MIDVIIACAGLGARFLSHKHHFPKGLAPVGGVPLLGHLLSQFKNINCINHIYVSAFQGFDLFESYVQSHPLSSKITLVFDPSLGGFQRLLDPNLVESDHVVLMHGDNFYWGSLRPFFESITHSQAFDALTFNAAESQNVGVFLKDQDGNSSFHEKVRGLPSFLAFAAVIHAPLRRLTKLADHKSQFFLSEDLVPNVLGELNIFCFEGDVIDVGSPSSFVNCNQLFSSSKSSEEFDFDRKWVSRHRNQISMLEECFFGNPKE